MKIAAFILPVLMACGVAHSAEPTKKLIEFGWDEPDTEFMRQYIAEMEKRPFDGCVFHVNYRSADGRKGNFTWEGWGKRAFTESEVQGAIDDLKVTQFNRFTDNFVRFNTTPGKVDWFDEFTPIVNNARLIARVARDGKCKGILFDIEQYEGPLFDYRKQRDAASKSWDVYAAQVRQRGREVMNAFQEGYPDLTVFLTFGYILPWQESGGGKKPLADCHYGLLAPFIDGLVDAAKGKTRLVDGHESSYGYREDGRFEKAYQAMKSDLLPIVADDAKYEAMFSFGFGIWMDHNWRKNGWNEQDFSKNYFTPERFEASLREAMKTSDEYVWIYTETPRWWGKDGKPEKLPQAYEQAVRQARKGLAKD